MGRLDGKVALITGAARGQGEAEARLFVAEGCKVVIADVLTEEGIALAKELGDEAFFVELDVASELKWKEVVEKAEERFGGIHVLVNNAGILRSSPIVDTPLDAYLSVVQVNQVGCFLGMRTVAPVMRDCGGGSMINVSSLSGFRGSNGTVAYTASKFAVRGMSKVAAIEFGPWKIRVNSLHPGGVKTPMVTDAAEKYGITDVDQFYEKLPLSRIGQPQDIARVAAFLASDESGFCTGAEFVADGGEMAGTW